MISKELSKLGFRQLVQEPTHIQGCLIDYCYVLQIIFLTNVRINQKSVDYASSNMISKELSKLGFRQLVQEPNHIQGCLIDYCYVLQIIFLTSIWIYSPL